MPGNKPVFQDAIKKGHNAAWDGNWKKAIAEYQRAISEFPQDATAHLSLAHALEEAGQLENAVYECRIASKMQPHDPQPLIRIAGLQEKLGNLAEAAGTYLAIADGLVAQKAMGKAVEMWQRAAALEPDRSDVHQRLAEVYEQGALRSLAAKEYASLARIYHRRGDREKATAMAQKALTLDPLHAQAKALVNELQPRQAQGRGEVPSPVGQAQKDALARLAETLLEEKPSWARADVGELRPRGEGPLLSQPEIDALIARAVDAQTQHRVGDAIDAYRKLLAAGVTRPEVRFNLGLLYLETMRYEESTQLLSDTVNDPNYALASHYALGQCYRAQGQVDSAVEHFLQVTKIVDLAGVQRDQADELISVYEGLAESFIAKGDREQAESFSRALEEFLSSKGWEDKVREVRHHLETLREEGGHVSLAEVLEVPGSADVLEALSLSQEYLRRGKFEAAGEECYRAIELAPTYLPAHLRLAEILAREGRLDDARDKYRYLAELSLVRGDVKRVEAFYRQLLKVAEGDVGDRAKLIDLLIQQGRNEEALQEYLELGDEHFRAARMDKAAEKYGEGGRLAARSGLKNPTTIKLLHRLAEARLQLADLKGALSAYQELRQQSPDDERARLDSVDLQFRLGQTAAALRDLEELVNYYRTRSEPQKAIAVLEELTRNHPNEAAPRAWLVQTYLSNGERDKAITALDALGELQLSVGQKQAAAATVRQIIALNPPRVEEYKQLLKQIGE